jgi:sulfur-oxidizing protein SoxZ
MGSVEPRVQAPGAVMPHEVFQVRTLINHPMETGLRRDSAGNPIPRNLINTFTCRYNDAVVFTADLREGVSANPFISFYVRAKESGRLIFTWEEDGGAVFTLETPLTVRA